MSLFRSFLRPFCSSWWKMASPLGRLRLYCSESGAGRVGSRDEERNVQHRTLNFEPRSKKCGPRMGTGRSRKEYRKLLSGAGQEVIDEAKVVKKGIPNPKGKQNSQL